MKHTHFKLLLLLVLLISACTDGAEEEVTPTVTQVILAYTATPTATQPSRTPTLVGEGDILPDAQTATPTMTPPTIPATLPPTWTPLPTATPARMLPTAEITRMRPSATPFVLPTYTPSYTPVAPGPLLTITEAQFNEELTARLADAAGQLYTNPPRLTLQEDLVTVTVNAVVTSGDATITRELVIDFGLAIDYDKIAPEAPYSYFTDTNAIYLGELRDLILAAIQQMIADEIEAATGGQTSYIDSVVVTPDGVIVQLVTPDE